MHTVYIVPVITTFTIRSISKVPEHISDCERCNYWDNVYRMHLAHVSSQTESEEITDEEMLSAAESMETDASN